MTVWSLHREVLLPRDLSEVFSFFADPANLERITPPWLAFRILTPLPIEMREGIRIDYRIRLRGIPLGWTSEITVWDPPHRFVDTQVRGPYRTWIHEHEFRPAAGGTLVTDRVRYEAPGGPLVHRFLVRPDVERIFSYRTERLRERFGAAGTPDAPPRDSC